MGMAHMEGQPSLVDAISKTMIVQMIHINAFEYLIENYPEEMESEKLLRMMHRVSGNQAVRYGVALLRSGLVPSDDLQRICSEESMVNILQEVGLRGQKSARSTTLGKRTATEADLPDKVAD